MTGCKPLAVTGEETGASTDDDHLVDPGRLKPETGDPLIRPDLHLLAGPGRQDAIEALLRQLRPAIVRVAQHRALLRLRALATGELAVEPAGEAC